MSRSKAAKAAASGRAAGKPPVEETGPDAVKDDAAANDAEDGAEGGGAAAGDVADGAVADPAGPGPDEAARASDDGMKEPVVADKAAELLDAQTANPAPAVEQPKANPAPAAKPTDKPPLGVVMQAVMGEPPIEKSITANQVAGVETIEAYIARHPDMRAEGRTDMFFPSRVLLTLDTRERVAIEPGIREIPNSLVDHWWLKAQGAKKKEKST